MGKFKTALQFSLNDKLYTTKGELTDWIYIQDLEKNSRTGRRYIEARCKCGKQKRVCLNNIRNGTSTSCGLKPCRGVEKEKDKEVGHKAIMYVYKKHAVRRGLSFELSYETFKSLIGLDCYYCKTPPSQVYQLKHPGTDKIRSGVPVFYNGIDRVDSKKGYTINNVVPCCKICNRAKSDLTLSDFKKWITKLKTFIENGTPDTACQKLSEKMGRSDI